MLGKLGFSLGLFRIAGEIKPFPGIVGEVVELLAPIEIANVPPGTIGHTVGTASDGGDGGFSPV